MIKPDQADQADQADLIVINYVQSIVLLPDSDACVKREAFYWAANVPLHPKCIVQPRTSEEVSRVVRVLANADDLVALPSGVHTQCAGSDDVHQGVTIDLGRMTDVTYDAHSKLASLQPGSRWGDIYEKLLNHSVCVTGGGGGNVGIGGFLTGGGNLYHAGLYRLACDNVANFDVVLANGDVVEASAKSYSELWTALMDGSGNFGIVTRLDMCTFPAHDLWGGTRAATRSEGDELAQTMVDFMDNNEKNSVDAYIINYSVPASQTSSSHTSLTILRVWSMHRHSERFKRYL
jgi:FAD/FMN-containing dehydrogenase